MRDFHKIEVWKRSHKLTIEIYEKTKLFPKEELFGIVSQLRRAMSSVPTNIAEGCGRNGKAELAQFMNIAAGSASEVEYHIILSKDLGYISDDIANKWIMEICQIRQMLQAYIKTLKADN